MPVIPTHKAAQQSDFGIFLKEISPALSQETIVHAHRDDYYIFGMVDSMELGHIFGKQNKLKYAPMIHTVYLTKFTISYPGFFVKLI